MPYRLSQDRRPLLLRIAGLCFRDMYHWDAFESACEQVLSKVRHHVKEARHRSFVEALSMRPRALEI